ncbi:hypothetical protein Mapa_004274 [Marchantia paleacea]|nr:hypothetical protein Mapa_004274 [Marchantia paleacea]
MLRVEKFTVRSIGALLDFRDGALLPARGELEGVLGAVSLVGVATVASIAGSAGRCAVVGREICGLGSAGAAGTRQHEEQNQSSGDHRRRDHLQLVRDRFQRQILERVHHRHPLVVPQRIYRASPASHLPYSSGAGALARGARARRLSSAAEGDSSQILSTNCEIQQPCHACASAGLRRSPRRDPRAAAAGNAHRHGHRRGRHAFAPTSP